MAETVISVLNASTAMTDGEVQALVPVMQKQVDEDFDPAWNIDASLEFVAKDQTPQPGSWWLSIFDDSDQAGALGYHDVTDEGLPLGKVFAGTDHALGLEVSVTFSHELLEILADPEINRCVFLQRDDGSGIIVAYESCDAVEADELGYEIDGVLVSDFVTPRWFMPGFPGPYDFKERCSGPLELRPGGYISVYEVGKGMGWQQVTADATTDLLQQAAPMSISAARAVSRPKPGSRRERRRTPRRQWERSTVHFAGPIAPRRARPRDRHGAA
jgi:hypothetical protein